MSYKESPEHSTLPDIHLPPIPDPSSLFTLTRARQPGLKCLRRGLCIQAFVVVALTLTASTAIPSACARLRRIFS